MGSSLGSPSVTTIDRSLLLIGKSSGVDVPATQVNWSGPISGSGQLIKTGLGTLQLTGVNTYAGGTKVSAGTLQVQSDADLGKAGAPVILSGGALAIEVPRGEDDFATSRPISLTDPQSSVLVGNNAGAATLSGPVTGEALNKTGAGKLILTGANAYTKTNIFAGEVRGNSDTIDGDVTFFGPGVLTFAETRTSSSNFFGSITGPGRVVVDRGSSFIPLTLFGKNNYTGGTIVNSTVFGTSDSLQGQIVNNAGVGFQQDFDGTYAGDMTGAGELAKFGSGNLTTTGRIELVGVSANVVVHEGRFTVDGTVVGDDVFARGGTLIINGSVTSRGVEVDPLAKLGGSGRIVGNVDDKGGEIEPGNSIGTLHIVGALLMEPHSEYQVQINGNGSDEIEVSKTAAIESSSFEIERFNAASSPVVPGKTYTIVTTGDGLTVEEPTLAIADFPFINFTLSEDAFNGYLTTSRSAERFAELASTPNEAAVANALDSATSTLAWQQVVGASTADARASFSSLSNASIHASAAGVLSEQSHFLRDAVLDRLRQDFPVSDAPAPADGVLSYAGDAPLLRP